MKEQDVEKLATLLNKKPEDVTAALEGEGIGSFIDEFESNHEVYTKADFEKFKANYETQVEEKWLTSKVPKRIYDKIKGTVFEVKEKELATKFGVDEFNGMDELIDKITNKQAKNPNEDVAAYKAQIDRLTKEFEEKERELIAKNDSRYIASKVDELISSVPIAGDGKLLENQRKVLRNMINTEFQFAVDNDRVVIKNAPVEFTQKNLDPRPLFDVVMDYAKDYVNLSSDGGGRGDISSTSTTSRRVNLKEYCEKNGIMPNSPELAETLKKFREQGVEIYQ